MNHVAHWDEAPTAAREVGHLRATWTFLGESAGSVGIGARRIAIEPGACSTPVHTHSAEEELFFVLEGSGLSWQDGTAYEVGAGDLLLHPPNGPAHTLRAGDDGLVALAFGPRVPAGSTVLPRAGVAWLWPTWTEVGAGDNPFAREAAAGPPEFPAPSPRPATIVALADVPLLEVTTGDTQLAERDLARAAGSTTTGLAHVSLEPGCSSYPPHCHSAEEELFIVLEGEGRVELGPDDIPLRAGSIVARPPGTKVPHRLHAGDAGLVYLAYGTREPNDIAYYPRSGKVALRGVGVIGRLEPADYWDGED